MLSDPTRSPERPDLLEGPPCADSEAVLEALRRALAEHNPGGDEADDVSPARLIGEEGPWRFYAVPRALGARGDARVAIGRGKRYPPPLPEGYCLALWTGRLALAVPRDAVPEDPWSDFGRGVAAHLHAAGLRELGPWHAVVVRQAAARDAAEAALTLLRPEAEWLRARAAALEERCRELETACQTLDSQLRAAQAASAAWEAKGRELHAALEALYASRSWRWTAPLRAASDWLRLLRRRPHRGR